MHTHGQGQERRAGRGRHPRAARPADRRGAGGRRPPTGWSPTPTTRPASSSSHYGADPAARRGAPGRRPRGVPPRRPGRRARPARPAAGRRRAALRRAGSSRSRRPTCCSRRSRGCSPRRPALRARLVVPVVGGPARDRAWPARASCRAGRRAGHRRRRPLPPAGRPPELAEWYRAADGRGGALVQRVLRPGRAGGAGLRHPGGGRGGRRACPRSPCATASRACWWPATTRPTTPRAGARRRSPAGAGRRQRRAAAAHAPALRLGRPPPRRPTLTPGALTRSRQLLAGRPPAAARASAGPGPLRVRVTGGDVTPHGSAVAAEDAVTRLRAAVDEQACHAEPARHRPCTLVVDLPGTTQAADPCGLRRRRRTRCASTRSCAGTPTRTTSGVMRLAAGAQHPHVRRRVRLDGSATSTSTGRLPLARVTARRAGPAARHVLSTPTSRFNTMLELGFASASARVGVAHQARRVDPQPGGVRPPVAAADHRLARAFSRRPRPSPEPAHPGPRPPGRPGRRPARRGG